MSKNPRNTSQQPKQEQAAQLQAQQEGQQAAQEDQQAQQQAAATQSQGATQEGQQQPETGASEQSGQDTTAQQGASQPEDQTGSSQPSDGADKGDASSQEPADGKSAAEPEATQAAPEAQASTEPMQPPAPAADEDKTAEGEDEAAAPVVAGPPVVTGVAEVDTLLVGASPLVIANFQQLASYVEAMKPKKPVTTQAQARNQLTLYTCVMSLINKSGRDFECAFTALIKFFNAHRDGALGPRFIFRAPEESLLTAPRRDANERVMNLLMTLAPSNGNLAQVKQALKQVDLKRSLAVEVEDQARERVIAFLNG